MRGVSLQGSIRKVGSHGVSVQVLSNLRKRMSVWIAFLPKGCAATGTVLPINRSFAMRTSPTATLRCLLRDTHDAHCLSPHAQSLSLHDVVVEC